MDRGEQLELQPLDSSSLDTASSEGSSVSPGGRRRFESTKKMLPGPDDPPQRNSIEIRDTAAVSIQRSFRKVLYIYRTFGYDLFCTKSGK